MGFRLEPDMARERLEPGPAHPITIRRTGHRVTVQVGGRMIADTTEALTLREAGYPAVQYLPLDAVDAAVLRPSDNETYCPYKGEASYYSVATDAGELTDAVWTYRQPYRAVAAIKNHVAFYPRKVDITVN